MLKTDAKWDKITDVVIVGYGMAGAAAAMTARDEGAEAMILDKMQAENFHTNSSLSGGIVMGSNDARLTARYFEALNSVGIPDGHLWTEREIANVFAEYCADHGRWLSGLRANVTHKGSNVGEHGSIPGGESIEYWTFAGSGLRMMSIIYERVKEKGVAVEYGTGVKRLLTNLRGEVIGVRADMPDGRTVDIGASRGVVLCSGGFEHNDRMKLQYLKMYPVYFKSPLTCTGDGIPMAMEVGADLWHMNCSNARIALKPPELPWGFTVEFAGRGWTRQKVYGIEKQSACGYLVVDKLGNRFTNEEFKIHAMHYELTLFDSQRLDYPRIPCYWVFDQKRIDDGALVGTSSGPAGPHQLYHWSVDNSAEIEKGWIFKARTIKELAEKLGLPGDALQRTVRKYNRACAARKDAEFGRPATSLVGVDNPPYYACRMWPGGAATIGGPRRNARAEILNLDGEPIPGLYGAGELGCTIGMLYPAGGGHLSECIAFGRIAGENVARTAPRSLEPSYAGAIK